MDKDSFGKYQTAKEKRNAVILAHNYQAGEVQDIADFVGDSLGLSRQAAATDADVIVFCGVHFMAETAKILSPHKTVLLPDKYAGCPMADMINAQQLRELKASIPEAIVVCYVNSSAEVKAESDYCCTSANAVEVVNSLPADKEIIFVPDKYLGQYTAEKTGRNLILWPGYCPTHANITADDIKKAKAAHPGCDRYGPSRVSGSHQRACRPDPQYRRNAEIRRQKHGNKIHHRYRNRHYSHIAKTKSRTKNLLSPHRGRFARI